VQGVRRRTARSKRRRSGDSTITHCDLGVVRVDNFGVGGRLLERADELAVLVGAVAEGGGGRGSITRYRQVTSRRW
jgi:hypothetical protein